MILLRSNLSVKLINSNNGIAFITMQTFEGAIGKLYMRKPALQQHIVLVALQIFKSVNICTQI